MQRKRSENWLAEDKARKIKLLLSKQLPNHEYNGTNNCTVWDISHLFTRKSSITYAVVILNRPISQSQDFMKILWNNAAVRIAVDGGTVEWDKYIEQLNANNEFVKCIDLITGDFDSITDACMNKYKSKGCKIIHTPNQDLSDFTKALIELKKYCQQEKIRVQNVIAIAQTSGRIDHIFGNIETLYLNHEMNIPDQTTRLYLMSDDSLSWLLRPGDHVIVIPEKMRFHKKIWCSIVPVGETCRSITTTGLKWNLENSSLKFGKLVSTSNTYDGSEKVTVRCSNTVLWSTKLVDMMNSEH